MACAASPPPLPGRKSHQPGTALAKASQTKTVLTQIQLPRNLRRPLLWSSSKIFPGAGAGQRPAADALLHR